MVSLVRHSKSSLLTVACPVQVFGLVLLVPCLIQQAPAQYSEVYVQTANSAMGAITSPTSLPANVPKSSTITAVSEPGYRFVAWSIDAGAISINNLNGPNQTMTLLEATNDTYTVTAHFEPIMYRLRLFNNGNGSITMNGTPDSAGGTFPENTDVNLAAEPDAYNVFVKWDSVPTNALHGTNPIAVVTMTGNIDIYATFASGQKYRLFIESQDASGRIVGNPTVNGMFGAGTTLFDYNDDVDILVDMIDVTGEGERVQQWGWVKEYGSGTVRSGIGNVPRFQITEDTRYRFDWKTQYLLETSVVAALGGSGSIGLIPLGVSAGEGRYWYDAGTEVQVTALVPAGSRFAGWNGDVELDESLPQNLITMNGPRAVQAAVESDLANQEIELLSLTHDGQLLWSNVAVGGYATVEWASTVTGNWHSSWGNLVSIPSTGGVMSARVPLFYRVTWSSNLVDTGSANQNDFIGTCANTSSVTPDSVSMPATSRETSVNAE